uniref:uncharacterized protein n=1 Tax=Myxine glutinosa TaxID=7769 RepID=UPI00358E884B
MGEIASAKETGPVWLSSTARAISSVWFQRSVELSQQVGGTGEPSTTVGPFGQVTSSLRRIARSARVTPYVWSISPTQGRTAAVLEGVIPSVQEGSKPPTTPPCLVTSHGRTFTQTADKNLMEKEPEMITPEQERLSSSVSQTTTTTTTMIKNMTTAKRQNIPSSILSNTTDPIRRISVSASPSLIKTLSSKNEECSGPCRAPTYVNLFFPEDLVTSSIVPFSSSEKMPKDLPRCHLQMETSRRQQVKPLTD